MLRDETVLLVYWGVSGGPTVQCKVQMEYWDGTDQCNLIFVCKGKMRALKHLLTGNVPGYPDVLGEVGATS